MALRVAIQMDPPATLNPKSDSTIALALEAQARGHTLFYYHPTSLSCGPDGLTTTHAQPIRFNVAADPHFTAAATTALPLESVDVVLMRQDPPYDMAYLTATYLLDQLHNKTLVVNNPTTVRNAPEKLSILQFPDAIPPTLISRDLASIESFRTTHRDIIIKPLYGFGGHSVYRITPDDQNFYTLLEQFFLTSKEPLMIQPFLPEVTSRDLRVILIDGAIAGVFGRIPAEGVIRANLRVGGTAVKATLNDKQQSICERVGVILKQTGIVFAGLDLIGDYLTEINVTSPTGLRAVQTLYGTNPAATFWDAIETRC